MRKVYRYDFELGKHITREEWIARNGSQARKSFHVIPDIEPYQPVTGDMQGKWVTSRSEHREFLRRNNLTEVGNEKDYFTRHGGMAPDNPNLMSESKHEEQICRSLIKNLEQLKRR